MKQDVVFERVNKIVLDGLKKDGLKWFKAWGAGEECRPFNLSNNRFYSGFNVFILNAEMRDKNYKYNQWMTFKQVIEKGGKIIKGSKSTEVYFWSIGYWDNKLEKYVPQSEIKNIDKSELMEDGKSRYRQTFSIKFYKVFNVAQCEGIEPKKTGTPKANNEPVEIAETIAKNYLQTQKIRLVNDDLDAAYYNRIKDVVNMPKLEQFKDSASYYHTLYHELAHSTGHETRLNRASISEIKRWGDKSYSKEELVAEISAMYSIGYLGLDSKELDVNSQAYIKSWIQQLEDKPKECVFAMQQATKAVELIGII